MDTIIVRGSASVPQVSAMPKTFLLDRQEHGHAQFLAMTVTDIRHRATQILTDRYRLTGLYHAWG
jgi:hypothetical protein